MGQLVMTSYTQANGLQTSTMQTCGLKRAMERYPAFPKIMNLFQLFLNENRISKIFLHIEVWTFSCSIVRHVRDLMDRMLHLYDTPPATGKYLRPKALNGVLQLLHVQEYLNKDSLLGKNLTGIILGGLNGVGRQITVLLVEKRDEYAERVGAFSLDDFQYSI
jgi:hypothetical protein